MSFRGTPTIDPDGGADDFFPSARNRRINTLLTQRTGRTNPHRQAPEGSEDSDGTTMEDEAGQSAGFTPYPTSVHERPARTTLGRAPARPHVRGEEVPTHAHHPDEEAYEGEDEEMPKHGTEPKERRRGRSEEEPEHPVERRVEGAYPSRSALGNPKRAARGAGGHSKPPLGSGGRFAALEAKIAARGGVRNPAAVAAAIGRKKYGSKAMGQMSHHMPGAAKHARAYAAAHGHSTA